MTKPKQKVLTAGFNDVIDHKNDLDEDVFEDNYFLLSALLQLLC